MKINIEQQLKLQSELISKQADQIRKIEKVMRQLQKQLQKTGVKLDRTYHSTRKNSSDLMNIHQKLGK